MFLSYEFNKRKKTLALSITDARILATELDYLAREAQDHGYNQTADVYRLEFMGSGPIRKIIVKSPTKQERDRWEAERIANQRIRGESDRLDATMSDLKRAIENIPQISPEESSPPAPELSDSIGSLSIEGSNGSKSSNNEP